MAEDLFSQDDNLETQIDNNKNWFEELVGENKKFKTPADLAKGKAESDHYIRILEKRLDDLRNDYTSLRNDATSRANLEQLVNQLREAQRPASSDNQNANEDMSNKPVFNPDEVKSMISNELQEFEKKRSAEQNYKLVSDKIRQHFGNNYQSALTQQISELGMSPEEFNDLARRNPNLVLRTLGLDRPATQDTFQPPPRGSQQTSFTPTTEKRTWSYYQKMKRENPAQYHNPKTAIQMEKDYLALGTEFEDGDFRQKLS